MAKKHRERELFEVYLTDGLKTISESISSLFGGRYLSKRYYDILRPPKPIKESPKQIIDRIKQKIEDIENERI